MSIAVLRKAVAEYNLSHVKDTDGDMIVNGRVCDWQWASFSGRIASGERVLTYEGDLYARSTAHTHMSYSGKRSLHRSFRMFGSRATFWDLL